MNMKIIKNWMIAAVFAISVGGLVGSSVVPQTASAAVSDKCNSGLLGFPSWYRGLTKDDGTKNTCNLINPTTLNSAGKSDGLGKFLWIIVLNCLEIALVAIGYITAFYFLYGGFLFVTSRGNPEGAAKARTTLLNATIGLAISLAAVTLVNFIIDKVFLKL